MEESKSSIQTNQIDESVDLQELFHTLLHGRNIIFAITAFASIISVVISLFLPNQYESRAILAPVDVTSGGISGALQSYSGLANLAGISIPSGSDGGHSKKAIKKITSLSFFENSIYKNIHLPDLMALKSWNYISSDFSYNDEVYDVKNKTWVREYSYPMQQIPSAQESYQVFKSNHLGLSEDNKSGFITISMRHQSPLVAKQWLELIVNEVNNFYRQKDKSESERAVSYLNEQMLITRITEIKQAIAELLQEETKKLTLIEANEFYVFEYIDPPAAMEVKSQPKRFVILVISALVGIIMGMIYVLLKHYSFGNKRS